MDGLTNGVVAAPITDRDKLLVQTAMSGKYLFRHPGDEKGIFQSKK